MNGIPSDYGVITGSTSNGVTLWPPSEPYQWYYNAYYSAPWTTEPVACIGKAHVFACDHEPKCLCGKIRRVMPKATKCRS